MNLFLLIIICSIGGFFIMGLTITDPYFGGVICFGIILGCLLKGLFLLRDIRDHLLMSSPEGSKALKKDKVKEAYERYLKEKNINKIEEKYSIKKKENRM